MSPKLAIIGKYPKTVRRIKVIKAYLIDIHLICFSFRRGMRYSNWLRHYAASCEDTGSFPDEVTGFFNIPNPSTRYAPGIHSVSNSNKHQESSCGVKVSRSDNFTSISEPIF
jgi:hypothetical protein